MYTSQNSGQLTNNLISQARLLVSHACLGQKGTYQAHLWCRGGKTRPTSSTQGKKSKNLISNHDKHTKKLSLKAIKYNKNYITGLTTATVSLQRPAGPSSS